MNPHSWQATSAEPVAVTTATEVPIVWLLMEAVITKPGNGYGSYGSGYGYDDRFGSGYGNSYGDGYGDHGNSYAGDSFFESLA